MIKQKTLKQNISNRIMVNGNKRTSEKVLFKTLNSIQKSQANNPDELSALNIKKPVQNVDGTIDVEEDGDDIFSFEDI